MMVCLLFSLCAAPPTHAQNLVGNPGFETGSFPPWTATSSGGLFVSTFHNSSDAHTGNYSSIFSADVNTNAGIGSISQTLTTVAGQEYTLAFWLRDDRAGSGGGTDSFTVSWNGNALPTLSVPGDFTYHQYSSLVTATGTSTALTFTSPTMSLPGEFFTWNFFLDDVSVQVNSVSTVPAPGGFTLLCGLTLLGGSLVRRRILQSASRSIASFPKGCPD
jgi:hypothetical protein